MHGMALSRDDFAAELRASIDAGRSFGGHPLWLRIQEGKEPSSSLRTFAIQFFLQVREFPRAISALHANCPDPEQRAELAESLYEEETGRISGCGLPHPELFIQFGLGLGMEREELLGGEPLPSTAALIDWFELSSKQRSFVEGSAAMNLAAEGQVPGSFAPFARGLEKHYGLTPEAVAFWDVHETADADHSDVGKHIVLGYATSDEWQERVRRAVQQSLAMWWQFFDGIERRVSSTSSG
jgi:pyrroloquinoline-quinone synthase